MCGWHTVQVPSVRQLASTAWQFCSRQVPTLAESAASAVMTDQLAAGPSSTAADASSAAAPPGNWAPCPPLRQRSQLGTCREPRGRASAMLLNCHAQEILMAATLLERAEAGSVQHAEQLKQAAQEEGVDS